MKLIKKIDELLGYHQTHELQVIKEVKEKFQKEDFCNFLEWDRIEYAAEAQLKLELINHFIKYISTHTPTSIRNNMEYIVESAMSQLMGNGIIESTGLWIRCSTSPGHRRIEIIKANFLRWQINFTNTLIKYFDEWQNARGM